MKKKSLKHKMISRSLLIALFSFVCASTSVAQDSFTDIIANARSLFSPELSSMNKEYGSTIISFFNNCSNPQKDAILSYMVQAITDSLKAENKLFAMNYIDYYRLIASPDDEYLSSLVVAEGRYYYEQMDASKLSELTEYLNDIAVRSSLNYSFEITELHRMTEEVLHGWDDLIGYWVVDSDNEKGNLCFVDIYKDDNDEYHVDVYVHYFMEHTYKSVECQQTRPGSLSFCWTSENMKIGKEELASALRSVVQGVSNSIIGELARSSTHSFGTSLLGSAGTMLGEVLINSIIDGLSISKKTIQILSGDIMLVNKNILSASFNYEEYKFRSDNTDFDMNNKESKVNLIRYRYDDEYVKNNIVFITENWLTQRDPLSKKERKEFYKRHPEVRKIVRKISNHHLPWGTSHPFKTMRAFNKEQVEKLKEYNLTH